MIEFSNERYLGGKVDLIRSVRQISKCFFDAIRIRLKLYISCRV